MARRIPPAETTLVLLHPTLSLSLLLVWLAASIVVLATICASCHRKPATSSPKSPSSPASGSGSKSAAQEQEPDEQEHDVHHVAGDSITELETAVHGPIYPTSNVPAGSTSKRRLSVSLSMAPLKDGIKDGLSRIKTKKEGLHHGKGAAEDSLWKKTIILGEKCKMQSDSDDDGDQEKSGGGTQSQQLSRESSFASAVAEASH